MGNNQQLQAHSGKLPFGVKLAYGLSGYSSFITWTIFSLYGLYFFTDVVGLSAGFAGAIISLGTIWDAATDPLIGALSDNRKSDKGRRRPLIVGVAVPFCLISILLFTNFGFEESLAKIYFVIAILLYYTAQTVLDISCSALGSEMTLDYDERSSLATYKNFFCMLVVIIVSPTLMLVGYFGQFFENASLGWACTLALYMIIALGCILIIWRATRGYERFQNTEKIEFKNVKDIFAHNKAIRFVMIIFALGVFGNTLNLSLQVYYWSYYVQLSDGQIATVMTVGGVAACIAAFGIDILCRKLSKKAAWIVAIGLEAAAMILFIGFLIQPGNFMLNCVLFVLIALGVCAIYQVPWSMIPDCVEIDEMRSGKRIEGLIFGFTAFLQKASAAIGIAVVGAALEVIHYVPGVVQTAETLFSLKMLYAFGVGIPLILSVLIIIKYPLSKQRHQEVLEAIERKKQGIAYDPQDFKDLM